MISLVKTFSFALDSARKIRFKEFTQEKFVHEKFGHKNCGTFIFEERKLKA